MAPRSGRQGSRSIRIQRYVLGVFADFETNQRAELQRENIAKAKEAGADKRLRLERRAAGASIEAKGTPQDHKGARRRASVSRGLAEG